MRPTRLLLCLCFFSLTVIISYTFWIAHAPGEAAAAASSSKGTKKDYHSLFSWHMPSTLFPQSAIISLTDDNSTFFLSRPANYGPRLPTDGLSGQLWIGSGFSDETVLRGGAGTTAEGELGCSDIPGWDPNQIMVASNHVENAALSANDKDRSSGASFQQGSAPPQNPAKPNPADIKSSPRPDEADGTDDYLHWPLKDTPLSQASRSAKILRQGRTEHADIQSLQETAEIAGKVVLLSRGGCGFLEKTKWVQRRGGVALVVGDNIRGGPLTTMYANGDASNISIPSVFTTRTTAHLLSSLIPPKNNESPDDVPKGDQSGNKSPQTSKEVAKAKVVPEKVQTPNANTSPKTPNTRRSVPTSRLKKRSPALKDRPAQGWLTSVLSSLGWRSNDAKGYGTDSSRPPSSGRLNWVVSEDWDEDVGSAAKQQKPKDSKVKAKAKGTTDSSKAPNADGFVIGVQDWRDPDMMKPDILKESPANPVAQSKDSMQGSVKGQKSDSGLSGGSHTPGSGVYHQSSEQVASNGHETPETEMGDIAGKEGWLTRLFSSSSGESEASNAKAKAAYDKTVHSQYVKEKEFEEFAGKMPVEHEGLWVTITPTTISTTPFFDTLLVLVVSPLVTLTVVYALLLLRSRIRRRRWRAPKSVVDRLPVRTYHTISYSSTSTSSQTTSPEASSPTSPLLRTHSRNTLTRSRPRSRTTSMLAEEVSSSLDKATAKASLSKGDRKRMPPKKYNGRQIECVVCLEEYIDGQSRVMSLPCGHEFHAECITPWLTTRRRTCPICKGDVVRSLASLSNSSSTTDLSSTRNFSDPDDIQAEAAQTRNESPSAAIPIPSSGENTDLERGDDMAATLVNEGSAASSTWNWRELASRSLSVVRGESFRRTQEDRSR